MMRRPLWIIGLVALALCVTESLPSRAVPISWGGAGAFAFIPVTHSYSSPTSGATETIPVGPSYVVIEACGGGGSGASTTTFHIGGGGGSGARVLKTVTIMPANWGQTLTVTAPVGGGGVSGTNGASASAATVINGTFTTSLSISAGGGQGGDFSAPFTGGAGGVATGGDTNDGGNPGQIGGLTGGAGGLAVAGSLCSSGAGTQGQSSNTPSVSGGGGSVYFTYH